MNDPWFTWMKGRGSLRIEPRNARGWASMAVLILLMGAPAMLLPMLGRPHWWMAIALVAWLGMVLASALHLAWSRSEGIDLRMLGDELRAFREWRARRKPRH